MNDKIRAICYLDCKYGVETLKRIKEIDYYGFKALLCVCKSTAPSICKASLTIIPMKFIGNYIDKQDKEGCDELDNLCKDIVTYDNQEADVLLRSKGFFIKIGDDSYAKLSYNGSLRGVASNRDVEFEFVRDRCVQLVGDLREEVLTKIVSHIANERSLFPSWLLSRGASNYFDKVKSALYDKYKDYARTEEISTKVSSTNKINNK